MSIQTEINRISENVAATYSVLSEAGADIPATASSDNLAETAASIKAVLYTAQSLTDEQKRQARTNIGAISEVDVPQKGVDYWTEADQESIVQQVITALGTPVFGRIDADNNIVLTGELADGTYTFKYEDAEGNLTEIGTLEQGGISYTNQIPLSIDTDGSIFNGTGYMASSRNNSSGGVTAITSGTNPVFTVGLIPFKTGDILRFKDCYIDTNNVENIGTYGINGWSIRINYYMADKTLADQYSSWTVFTSHISCNTDTNGYVTDITATDDWDANGLAYIRLTLAGTPETAVITLNEEITGEVESGIAYEAAYGTLTRVGGEDYSMYCDSTADNYKTVYQTTGEVPYYNSADLATFTTYYPLSVPSGKTKVTIELPKLTSDQTLFMAVFGMTLSGNIYTRTYSSGWGTEGVYECEFGADIPYVGIHFRNSSYGGLNAYDFSGMTVTWS